MAKPLTIWIVKDGKCVQYRRTGECVRCGECCCKLGITFVWDVVKVTGKDKDNGDFTDWEGYSIFKALDAWWYLKTTSIKPHEEGHVGCSLFEDGLCTEHDDVYARRPICQFWPYNQKDIRRFPNCGFRIRKVRVTKPKEVT